MSQSRFKRFVLYPLVRGLTGFPLAIVGVLGAPFGLARYPAAGQRRIAEGFGGRVPPRAADARLGNGRSAAFSLVAVIPAAIGFFITGIWLMMIFTGYMYPIRPGVVEYIHEPLTPQAGLDNAWGGNTVIAAWIGHSVIAFPLHILGLVLLHFGYCRLQDSLVRKFL